MHPRPQNAIGEGTFLVGVLSLHVHASQNLEEFSTADRPAGGKTTQQLGVNVNTHSEHATVSVKICALR